MDVFRRDIVIHDISTFRKSLYISLRAMNGYLQGCWYIDCVGRTGK
ncbi:hypothetical protein [Thalassotalea sp. PS06]|nr:hypothetical protein [Thalassotalea sp. PS06]